MKIPVVLIAVALTLSACASARDNRMATGAAIGGASGAVVAGPVGLVVGAGAGALIADNTRAHRYRLHCRYSEYYGRSVCRYW
ncbi:MAG: hypothetical protein JO234_15555 [Hyphomicrobiales bacterium]|nr:hypothetical protein [Hyphomicrobiales bacterium]